VRSVTVQCCTHFHSICHIATSKRLNGTAVRWCVGRVHACTSCTAPLCCHATHNFVGPVPCDSRAHTWNVMRCTLVLSWRSMSSATAPATPRASTRQHPDNTSAPAPARHGRRHVSVAHRLDNMGRMAAEACPGQAPSSNPTTPAGLCLRHMTGTPHAGRRKHVTMPLATQRGHQVRNKRTGHGPAQHRR
jgi:hypothetical protein